mgnify:FL=1|jgi:acyl carrier protein
MPTNKIDNQLFLTLKKVFPRSKINKNIQDLKINSVKEWDSLGNFNLLLEIEKNFKFRFSPDQMSEVKSIKQIYKILKSK